MQGQQGEATRKGSATPGSTGPLLFLKRQNISSTCLYIPFNTTYLFSHDSWLPNQTNESKKSLLETFRKDTERRKQREFRDVLNFKGIFPPVSFPWSSSPGSPSLCLVFRPARGCH